MIGKLPGNPTISEEPGIELNLPGHRDLLFDFSHGLPLLLFSLRSYAKDSAPDVAPFDALAWLDLVVPLSLQICAVFYILLRRRLRILFYRAIRPRVQYGYTRVIWNCVSLLIYTPALPIS